MENSSQGNLFNHGECTRRAWRRDGEDRGACGGAGWASLPQPLFTEVLLRLVDDTATATAAGGGDRIAAERERGALLPARSGFRAAATDVASAALVCRDWLRLCREGLGVLRPASLPPPAAHAPVHPHPHPQLHPGEQQPGHHDALRSPHCRQPAEEQQQQQQQWQQQQQCRLSARVNGWMAFPHLTHLDLSAVQVAVQNAGELRRQQEALTDVGRVRGLRRLTLPMGLLARPPPARVQPAAATRPLSGKPPQPSATATAAIPRGPRLSWPAWLQQLPYLRELVVLTYCRTAAAPYHSPRDDNALLGLLYDSIRVANLPPLPALASLELQLPGDAVAADGGGLLRNLASLTSLELRSADSRPLAGMRLAAALSEVPGSGLTHLHLPCLSASPRQPLALQPAAGGGGGGGAGASGPPLEGLRALAAAAGFPLGPEPEPAPQPPPPPLPGLGALSDPDALLAAAAAAPPPLPVLRTSLRSLSLSGRCLLADLLAAAAHLSAVTSLRLAGCDVRPRNLWEGLLTRLPAGGAGVGAGGGISLWELLYGAAAAVPPPAWRLRRLDLSGCRWLTSVPLFAANMSRLLLSLSRPGDLLSLDLSATGISRLPEVLLLPPPPPLDAGLAAVQGPCCEPHVCVEPFSLGAGDGSSGGGGGHIGGGSMGASLTELDLSGNCLQAIPSSFADACPRLCVLRIDDNAAAQLTGNPTAAAAAALPHPHHHHPAHHGQQHAHALAPGGAAAAAMQLSLSGPGGGGGGRGTRLPALPPVLQHLSISVSGSAAAGCVVPLCPGAAVLAEHPPAHLRRLSVSHCSLPALISMLSYLPVLTELNAVHVPARVRGGVAATAHAPHSAASAGGGSDGAAAAAAAEPITAAGGGDGGGGAAAAAVARSLSYVTIRGDVSEEPLVPRRQCRTNSSSGGGGSSSGNGDGDSTSNSSNGGSSSSGNSSSRGSSDGTGAGAGGGDAALRWLERLCVCAPEMRTLSYTRMGLNAVPDGVAAAARLVALDLSRNRVSYISELVGRLSQLEPGPQSQPAGVAAEPPRTTDPFGLPGRVRQPGAATVCGSRSAALPADPGASPGRRNPPEGQRLPHRRWRVSIRGPAVGGGSWRPGGPEGGG